MLVEIEHRKRQVSESANYGFATRPNPKTLSLLRINSRSIESYLQRVEASRHQNGKDEVLHGI